MSMRCEVCGCSGEAGPPVMCRQEDDWTTVAVSLCTDHKKSIEAGALRIDRRTAQGCFDVIPGPGLQSPQGLTTHARIFPGP